MAVDTGIELLERQSFLARHAAQPEPADRERGRRDNAVGNSPGVGVIRVERGGRDGTFYARAPITHVVGGVERADPHGLAVLTHHDDD